MKKSNSTTSEASLSPSTPHRMSRRSSSIARMASGELPEDFMCPITQEKMADPVIAQDGHTYERKAIEAWFSTSNLSPMTNAPLSNKSLLPNFNLKSQISSWETETTELQK